MATSRTDIIVRLKAENKELKSSLRDANNTTRQATTQMSSSFNNMASNIQSAARTIIGAYVGLQGIRSLIGFMQQANQAAIEQRIISARMAQTLRTTGHVVGFTAQQLEGYANQLQDVTGISNEAIQAGQTMLLTFKNIRGEVYTRTTRALLDMASAMGDGNVNAAQLRSTAVQLGRALDSPLEGVTALTRQGVRFTEQQKQQIEEMVRANDIMGAQNIMLAELETQFGGTAKAINDASGGTRQLRENWADLSKELGEGLLPILTKAVEKLNNLVRNLRGLDSADIAKGNAIQQLTKDLDRLDETLTRARQAHQGGLWGDFLFAQGMSPKLSMEDFEKEIREQQALIRRQIHQSSRELAGDVASEPIAANVIAPGQSSGPDWRAQARRDAGAARQAYEEAFDQEWVNERLGRGEENAAQQALRKQYDDMLQETLKWQEEMRPILEGVFEPLQESLSDLIYAWGEGQQDMSSMFQSFADSLLKSWGKMISDMIAEALVLEAIGFFTTGGGSGLIKGVTSFFSSAGGEWDVPKDRMQMVHKNETILPADIAQSMRTFFANGNQGGGNMVIDFGEYQMEVLTKKINETSNKLQEQGI